MNSAYDYHSHVIMGPHGAVTKCGAAHVLSGVSYMGGFNARDHRGRPVLNPTARDSNINDAINFIDITGGVPDHMIFRNFVTCTSSLPEKHPFD